MSVYCDSKIDNDVGTWTNNRNIVLHLILSLLWLLLLWIINYMTNFLHHLLNYLLKLLFINTSRYKIQLSQFATNEKPSWSIEF